MDTIAQVNETVEVFGLIFGGGFVLCAVVLMAFMIATRRKP